MGLPRSRFSHPERDDEPGGTVVQDDRRVFQGTRGAVLARLRCAEQTVEELATALDLTPNAIRLHLQRLERDGLVAVSGTRRQEGVGKPAQVFGIAPGADQRFSRAYAPVLGALLAVLAERLEPAVVEALAREAGRRLAADIAVSATARPDAAVRRILEDLGGQAEVTRQPGGLLVEGCGCPLSEVTRGGPVACEAMQTLLATALGRPVTESCDRGARPRCRFLVDLQSGGLT
jgi:predicted ArsR family transcriptional regulator